MTKVHNSSDTIGRHQGEEHAHPAGEMQPSSWCPALVSREKRGETSSPLGTFVIWRNRCIYWIRNTSTESVCATIDFRYRILPLNLTTTYIQLHLALDCSKQFNLLFVYNLKKSWPNISFFFVSLLYQEISFFLHSKIYTCFVIRFNESKYDKCIEIKIVITISRNLKFFFRFLGFLRFSFFFISLFISHNYFVKLWFFRIACEKMKLKL